MTPLQRQQHREQRMMRDITGCDGTPKTGMATFDIAGGNATTNMAMILQQLAANAETPPACTMLLSAGSEMRARWQNELDDYDYRVWQYRQRHPWYVPDLSKWVAKEVWRDISEELLAEDDQTDGGPPNDIATESFLRQEGRYATQSERGKVQHANALKDLKSIKWIPQETHVKSYEAYISKWKQATRTMYRRQLPPQKM